MCTGQTKGDTSVEEQTRGGTPSEESTRRGVPSEEDFQDKLPISANWVNTGMVSKLSAGSSEAPNLGLVKEGNWTGGKNLSEWANGNFEGTTGKGTKSREGTKGWGCSKLKLSKESNRGIPSNETNEAGDGTENAGETEVAGRYESENSGKPG